MCEPVTTALIVESLTTAAEGAALGAGVSAITGGDIGKGALTGGITGGLIPGGGALGEAAGIGTTAGSVLGGAAGGALGAKATGGKVGQGALFGGISGGVSSALKGLSAPDVATPEVGSGGPGGAVGGPAAASPSAPASIPLNDPTLEALATQGAESVAPQSVYQPGAISTEFAPAPAGVTAAPFQAPAPVFQGVPGNQWVNPDTGLPSSPVSGGSAPSGPVQQAVGKGPTAFDKFLKSPGLSTGFDAIKDNPGAIIAAGGLGYQALQSQKPPEGLDALRGAASKLGAQGDVLQGYLTSGTLPPGVQSSLTSAAESAKASIRSRYASRGMSGSSAEAADLARVDRDIASKGADVAIQLLQTGIKETGLSSELYTAIMNGELERDKELGSAIGNFASSFAGGSPGLTIRA